MDLEFKDQPGTPANQQAKKLAKESAKAAKVKQTWKHIYTEVIADSGIKLVKVTAKPTGAQSIFIAKKPKVDGTPGAAERLKQYEAMKAGFKKAGEFVSADSFEEKINEMIKVA